MQRILIAGEGGQGVQLIAEVLARAAVKIGKKATYIPNFGVEQRGGVSLAFVILDERSISYPKFLKADYLVVMTERAKKRVESFQTSDTNYLDATAYNFQGIPNQAKNMYVLGRLAHLLGGLDFNVLWDTIEERIGSKFQKDPQLRKDDYRALKKGYED